MGRYPANSLMSFLALVPDPRAAMGRRHPLVAMLTHACWAMLCGCRGYAAIAQWGRDQPIEFMHRIGDYRTPASSGSFQAYFPASTRRPWRPPWRDGWPTSWASETWMTCGRWTSTGSLHAAA